VIPSASPACPLVRRKIRLWEAACTPGVPGLLPGDDPLGAVPRGGSFHVGGRPTVLGLGDPGTRSRPGRPPAPAPTRPLLGRSVFQHQQQPDVVATIMCSYCRSQCSRGPGWPGARGSGPCPRLVPSRPPSWPGTRTGSARGRRPGARPRAATLPFGRWRAARGFPVSAGGPQRRGRRNGLPSWVLERADLALDELVQSREIAGQTVDVEVHAVPVLPPLAAPRRAAPRLGPGARRSWPVSGRESRDER